jgi:hypothetical protein
MTNTTLAEWFWVDLLVRNVPQVPAGVGAFTEWGYIAWREAAGLAGTALYFLGLPVLLRCTLLRRAYGQMGRGRFVVLVLLLLTMLALPLKMILNWTMNLSYVINIPEHSFYF